MNESRYPHCDDRILHAPGECEFCDMHPDYQEARVLAGINFTGHNDPDKRPCPADKARGPQSYNRWGGNIARPPGAKVLGHDWAGYEITDADPRLPDWGLKAFRFETPETEKPRGFKGLLRWLGSLA